MWNVRTKRLRKMSEQFLLGIIKKQVTYMVLENMVVTVIKYFTKMKYLDDVQDKELKKYIETL